MSFTNINDPAGVKALLDQLRASQAWQEVVVPPAPEPAPSLPPNLEPQSAPVDATASSSSLSSVASLLSQLQSSPSWSAVSSTPPTSSTSEEDAPLSAAPLQQPTSSSSIESLSPPKKSPQDPRSYTFQQALPHLAQLADDPGFVVAITQMKKEQDGLERQLWEERRDIYRKYEDKVKVATTKANMIGDSGLSKHEADMLQTGFKKELDKFDRERVLLAWDGLVSKQQATLARHGVPTMYPTKDIADRERQQRVIQVLEGILRT
ncbi:hypothetical protein Hypma_012457 [Hypsizygus marmoreus]|uniref:Uncharacterized protein n=1 Tax=Hypsizygus marmoreus TaxID=39966 RepID=A0A369JMB1_HYPMA|nr:hypothetical protein Hypma_012457 [Hypsizygus marmoreus]